MSTIELEASVDEVPERWRKGKDLRAGDVLVVKMKSDMQPETAEESFWDVARRVGGIWSDRSDKEIEAWQSDMRAARKRRFESLFPDAE